MHLKVSSSKVAAILSIMGVVGVVGVCVCVCVWGGGGGGVNDFGNMWENILRPIRRHKHVSEFFI